MKGCCEKASPSRALVSGLIGILLFLITLVILRYIADRLSWPFFSGFVDLLYASATLIVLFSILFMFGDIFAALPLPLSLPFPFFNAAGAVLLVSFILRMIGFVDTFYSIGLGQSLTLVKLILYPLTFVVVLIAGYLSLFSGPGARGPREDSRPKEPIGGEPADPSWEEISREFRRALYALFHRIRDELTGKEG